MSLSGVQGIGHTCQRPAVDTLCIHFLELL
jgi:hypothetical protein